jgi:hypothetical protein
MKNILLLFFCMPMLSVTTIKKTGTKHFDITGASENLVVVTIDGVRWKEIFSGADSILLNDAACTNDAETEKLLYWANNAEDRRKRLMPFFWNVLAAKGQIMGNRDYDNKVDMANPYRISYAGYNELFTGNPDWFIFSNEKRENRNKNIFEQLNRMETYRNQVAVFSSWDVLPDILRRNHNNFFMNSAYEPIGDTLLSDVEQVQQNAVFEKPATRRDWLTYIAAREYLQKRQPRVLYLSLGETDEYAHRKRYDLYLHHLNAFDRMLGELWGFLQNTPAYRHNTTLIVTTDHGRGGKTGNWNTHGWLTPGSAHTWMAVLGPHIAPLGERTDEHQLYAREFPAIMRSILGIKNQKENANVLNNNAYVAGKSK